MLDDREKRAQNVPPWLDDVPMHKIQQQADEALKRVRQLLKLAVYPSDLYR